MNDTELLDYLDNCCLMGVIHLDPDWPGDHVIPWGVGHRTVRAAIEARARIASNAQPLQANSTSGSFRDSQTP
jgi:hypothetical protein